MMEIRLTEVTEQNFYDVINLKSDEVQETRNQIYERWVGSNAFFLGACQVFGYTPRAIYDGSTLIGFASYGFRKETEWHELISMMIGHQYQGQGYSGTVLKAVIDEMAESLDCSEIYITVIHDNDRAIRMYEKAGFIPTGEVEEGHHPEPVYCLKLNSSE
ncbi:GNAT family N-acetyltransferase [Bacillus infantis]|uniref:GNAT family N-acetyltransferase n=1 Tax=Bacillus infantis TaxID=324767 RepID=UPI003CF09B41